MKKRPPHRIDKPSAVDSRSLYLPDPETVLGRVLGAMLRGERLTCKECWLRFGSSRLAHHIYQLGKDGWPVDRIDIIVCTSDSGRRATIAEYWLSPAIIQAAGKRGQKFALAALEAEIRRRAA